MSYGFLFLFCFSLSLLHLSPTCLAFASLSYMPGFWNSFHWLKPRKATIWVIKKQGYSWYLCNFVRNCSRVDRGNCSNIYELPKENQEDWQGGPMRACTHWPQGHKDVIPCIGEGKELKEGNLLSFPLLSFMVILGPFRVHSSAVREELERLERSEGRRTDNKSASS